MGESRSQLKDESYPALFYEDECAVLCVRHWVRTAGQRGQVHRNCVTRPGVCSLAT
jgi:hypothetical protein